VDFDLATARKRKTITKHITGDSEVERTARKQTAPQVLTAPLPQADGEAPEYRPVQIHRLLWKDQGANTADDCAQVKRVAPVLAPMWEVACEPT
jgi:hypothetical protein